MIANVRDTYQPKTYSRITALNNEQNLLCIVTHKKSWGAKMSTNPKVKTNSLICTKTTILK